MHASGHTEREYWQFNEGVTEDRHHLPAATIYLFDESKSNSLDSVSCRLIASYINKDLKTEIGDCALFCLTPSSLVILKGAEKTTYN